jgi:transposase-like protein
MSNKYSAEDKARILANFEFLRASGIDAKSAARNAGASHTTVYRWMGEAKASAPAQNATTQHVAALTERVQSLEHDAQDAHQALYDARERLLALETRDTEPTPFHAVDRTYVIVIAIMVVTVAITLVTVLL